MKRLNKSAVKIIAVIIAVIFLLGIAGPLAYILASATPADEIGALKTSIEDAEAKLAEIEAELIAAEEVERRFIDEHGNRLRIFLEKGMMSYLDIILSAKSAIDFTDRIVIAKELIEYDRNMTRALLNIKSDINKRKTEAEDVIKQKKNEESKLAELIEEAE